MKNRINKKLFLKLPKTNPEKIFYLRDSSYANELFITAISYFDIFNLINRQVYSFDQLCTKLSIHKRPADVLLTLLKSYGFIEESGNKYRLTQLSKDFLLNDSAYNLNPYISSLKERPACKKMFNVLKSGKPANWALKKGGKDWSESMNNIQFAKLFSQGMSGRGQYLASGLLKCLDFNKYEKILDIGGGSGIYSAVILNNFPHLKATIFEKRPVNKVAEYFIKKSLLTKSISVVEGDMFKKDFPRDYDIHLISHVLHDWDMEGIKKILKNSYNNLSKGGALIIHDAHLNRQKSGPLSVAEYSVLLMFSTYGKCYSIAELESILYKTGFVDIKYKKTIINRSAIIARK